MVISNTSPLSNLAIIDRLPLVQEQFGVVVIPPAVQLELSRHPMAAAKVRIEQALSAGWLRVEALTHPVGAALAAQLDSGEAEALTLALTAKASIVLLDESAARIKARELGLACTGVLGILRKARKAGHIPSLNAEIQRLRNEASFFVGSELERALLVSVGETV